ncbi:MAG: ABC transporter ATP-binding protein [Proteobacteria bacterium]|nr:ABC transporter ATP-binding protein [Pseudomonadota bacterium]MDA1357557.1 ABC transporter ATP-binding protein [Pseudomonadota bacterium]
MSLVEARDITLSARIGDRSVEVLRHVSFTLEAGETLGLVGESGAGKSMIGRLFSQLLPPGFAVTAGDLTFDGLNLIALPAAKRRHLLGKRIAFVPQEPMTALNPVLSIGNQFNEHLQRLGVRGAQARRNMAIRFLSEVHLPDAKSLLGKYPHQLSGGMCQRVLIALAFAGDPALVVADEPTTALDVMTQARIMALIAEMQKLHGTAIILITHDLRLAAHVCDKILVMYAGDVVERSGARKLLTDPRHPYTRSLKRANPTISGPRMRLPTLPDQMPGLLEFAALSGCRFSPRCPVNADACRASDPALLEIGPGHDVLCVPACASGERDFSEVAAPPAPSGTGTGVPLVELKDVSRRFVTRGKWFADATAVDAVRNVSLTIHQGEFIGIVGESGSGKTTVARMIAGLDRPTEGQILVRGKDAGLQTAEARSERLETLQMIFQDPQSALNPRRMVESLLTQAMEADHRSHDAEERKQRAQYLMREIGLPGDSLRRYPSQLSGGQRQRVNIGRAICVAPKVLVADEIVSGLDVSVQAQILNLLLRLREELDISLLLISHDLSVVRYLCSRVFVMHEGYVVESGPTEQVFADPQHAYTRTLLAAVPPDDADAPWPPKFNEDGLLA